MSQSAKPGCARLAREAGEELPGTAPHALAWIVVEQPGPFGHDALFESRLPGDVARQLADETADSAIKIVLARRTVLHGGDPGAAPSSRAPSVAATEAVPLASRSIWWTYRAPAPKLFRLTFTNPRELLDLDWSALRSGRPDQVHPAAEVCRDPLLLLCTNGRRDVCCAALARPVAVQLARDERYRASFMESSHLGGHRFAPGALQLPHGWAHGRLDFASAGAVLDAARAGRIHLDTARGRCALPSMGQAAELAVRRAAGLDDFGAVAVSAAGLRAPANASAGSSAVSAELASSAVSSTRESAWTVTIAGVGEWTVAVLASPGPPRPESCGAEPVPMIRYETDVRPHAS